MSAFSDVKKKTLLAILWGAIGQYTTQLVTFITSVILARLLSPSEFGLIGMLSIFVALSQAFMNFGFTAAIIQSDEIDDDGYSTIFYINISISVVLYALLYLGSSAIAAFYNQPLLEYIVKIYMVVVVVGSVSMVPVALLTKQLNFKKQVKARLASAISSGIVGVWLALLGAGVWALVAQLLIANILFSVIIWFHSTRRPGLTFKLSSLKTVLAFSANTFIANLIDKLFGAIDNVIIGKVFSPSILGFFTRAKSMQEFPIKNSISVFEKVLFPVLSKINSVSGDLRASYKRVLALVAYMIIPLMFLMIIIGDDIIIVLLTDKWRPSIVLLRILSVAGLFKALSAVNSNALFAAGEARTILIIEVINKIIYIIAFVVGIYWGVIGVSTAIAVTWFSGWLWFSYAIKIKLKVTLYEQFAIVGQYAFLSILLAVVLIIAKVVYTDYSGLWLIQLLAVGSIAYYIISIIVKPDAYNEIVSIVAGIRSDYSARS